MLVEINLLPRKETRNVGFLVILSILTALFVLATVIYLYQINSAKKMIATTENQIEQTKIMEAELQKQLGTSATGNSVNQLKTAIDLASKNRIETIPVMLHLTSLLPARGFFQSFSYQESGAVSLTVQFDTPAEAAAYLDNLNKSSWIANVSLTSLNPSSNSANATANSGNNTTPTVGSNTTTNSNLLPRYTGQFTIQLNLDAVKKAIESGKKDAVDAEGVSGQ